MGIVMAVVMFVGVVQLAPWATSARLRATRAGWGAPAAATIIGLAGAWNTFWHGLRHLDAFWGQAALLSGLLMMAAAAMIVAERRRLLRSAPPAPAQSADRFRSNRILAWGLGIGLSGFFVLYAVTLIRLNLN